MVANRTASGCTFDTILISRKEVIKSELNTSLDQQQHNDRYPFILHWTQLPVCKESMDLVAGIMIARLKKIIEEKGGD